MFDQISAGALAGQVGLVASCNPPLLQRIEREVSSAGARVILACGPRRARELATDADLTFALVSADLGAKFDAVCELLDARAIPTIVARGVDGQGPFEPFGAGRLQVVGGGDDALAAIEQALVADSVANDGVSPEMLRVHRMVLRADERLRRQQTIIDRLRANGRDVAMAEALLRTMTDTRNNLDDYARLLAKTTSVRMR